MACEKIIVNNGMKQTLILLTLTTFLLSSLIAAKAAEEIPSGTEQVSNANTRFALDLYAQVQSNKGNLFFSPYSISTALAMTHAGAAGETARQMEHVLGIASVDQVNDAFGWLQRQIKAVHAKDEVELNIANGLWAQQDHPFREAFLAIIEKSYDAELRQVDFTRDPETVRLEINDWVEQQTREKIKDLLKPGVLNALARLVLVNAIYFKGDWAYPFEQNTTQDADFFLSAQKTAMVPMMAQQQRLKYMENEGLQAVELPYAGDDLSMIILLPREIDGLIELETSLSPDNLAAWTGQMSTREVALFLPRFELIAELNLVPPLSTLGMKSAFIRGTADFSAMDGSRELFLSSVVHKAFVKVNERGTEAAAATGVVVSVTSMPPPPVVFRADRPFVFLIRDKKSNTILFMGRLVEPTTTAEQ